MSTNGTTELLDFCFRLENTVKLMWTIIAPIITVGGLLSNMIVIVVFRYPRFLKSSPILHLFVLAISDCVALSIGPVRDWSIQTLDYDIKDTSDFVCKTSYFVLYVSLDFSSWILASVTLERAYGILKPIESRGMFTVKRAKVTLSVIFVVLSTVNMHFFFTNGLKSVEGHLKCTSLTEEYSFFEDFVFVWIDLCLVMLFPFCIMSICNLLIITFLRSKYDTQYRVYSTKVFRNLERDAMDDLDFGRETKISEIELHIHPDDAYKVSETQEIDMEAREDTRLDSDLVCARQVFSIEMSPLKPETSAANTVMSRRGSKTLANKKSTGRKRSRELKPPKRKSIAHEPVRKRSKGKNLPVQKTARKSSVRESKVRKKSTGSDRGVSTQQNRTTAPTIEGNPIDSQLISVKKVSFEKIAKVLDADPIQTENEEIYQNNKKILNVINTYKTQSETTPKNLDDTHVDAKGQTSQHTAHVLHHEDRKASVDGRTSQHTAHVLHHEDRKASVDGLTSQHTAHVLHHEDRKASVDGRTSQHTAHVLHHEDRKASVDGLTSQHTAHVLHHEDRKASVDGLTSQHTAHLLHHEDRKASVDGLTSQHTAHLLHHEDRKASVSQDKLDTSSANFDVLSDDIKSNSPETKSFLSRIYEFSSNLIRSLLNIRLSRPQRSSISKQYNQEIVRNVSRNLFMVTLIFWITMMPFSLYLIVGPFLRDQVVTCTRANAILDVVRASASMLVYVNSGANVFLYATCSPAFRSELHQMFGFQKTRRDSSCE